MNSTLALPNHVVFTDFNGAEGVLLNLSTQQYFKLNETGTLVWRALEASQSLPEAAAALTREYQVTGQEATACVQALCQKLAAHGLLELS